MASKFVDVSSYQGSSVAYFESLKKKGAEFVFIKLTDGTDYVNPYAAAQINSALKVFGGFGLYHFWHGESAKYFISIAHHYGIDFKSTPIALDVEATDLAGGNLTSGINDFEAQLRAVGVPKENIWTYGSASWFSEGRIYTSQLKYGFTWVAAYGSYKPACNAWQYTDGGGSQHWSVDYTGLLGGKAAKKSVKIKPHYYQHGNHFHARVQVKQYSDIHLKNPTGVIRGKDYLIHGKIVLDGAYPRIKTDEGNYYTASVAYVKRVD